jgi:hypothetical protein
VVALKQQEEEDFLNWVHEEDFRRMNYDHLIKEFGEAYARYTPLQLAQDLMDEAIEAVEIFKLVNQLKMLMWSGAGTDEVREVAEDFFKDYHMPIDRDVFASMMQVYRTNMPEAWHPAFFARVDAKYNASFEDYGKALFEKSILTDKEKMEVLIDLYAEDNTRAIERLESDPANECLLEFIRLYNVNIKPDYHALGSELDALYERYMAGLLEMHGMEKLYPDANRTMRITWGKVSGYEPRDGVEYLFQSTIEGLMEKADKGFEDYQIPDGLRDLYEAGDYGKWGEEGTLNLCFIASNHTSGGNSGSPVLDAHGRLIGLNFDREWEGTMSDIHYDPDLCRNIAVDIRYILFLIEKLAGAGYLIEEMDIIYE